MHYVYRLLLITVCLVFLQQTPCFAFIIDTPYYNVNIPDDLHWIETEGTHQIYGNAELGMYVEIGRDIVEDMEGVSLERVHNTMLDMLKEEGWRIAYNERGNTWYVISSINEGIVQYLKGFVLNDKECLLLMCHYPEGNRKICDKLVMQLQGSFKPKVIKQNNAPPTTQDGKENNTNGTSMFKPLGKELQNSTHMELSADANEPYSSTLNKKKSTGYNFYSPVAQNDAPAFKGTGEPVNYNTEEISVGEIKTISNTRNIFIFCFILAIIIFNMWSIFQKDNQKKSS